MEKQIINEAGLDSLYFVPKSVLEKILLNQERILELLSTEEKGENDLGDFISEQEAIKLIGRKTTWFWNLRKTGMISYTKMGSKVFYLRQEILKLLEMNKIKSSGYAG